MAIITGLSKERERVTQQRLFDGIAASIEVALRREIVSTMRAMARYHDSPGKMAEVESAHRESVTRILMRGWRVSFDRFGTRIINAATKSYGPRETKDAEDEFALIATNWIRRYGASHVTQIVGTTSEQARSIINEVVADAVRDGLGQSATGQLIVNAMREKSAMLSVARSRVIARTETHAASQAANVAAAQSVDIPMRKEWISASDDRTRQDHTAADGQVVKLNESFTVGGEQLEYPGDPSGSAENIINCRCSVAMVVDD